MKKVRERAQLDRFADTCRCLPAGEILETESPDFLVTHANGVLGIELTDLYWPNAIDAKPEQARESTRQLIARKVRQSLMDRGAEGIWVGLTFGFNYEFHRMLPDQIVESIVALVVERVPSDGESVEIGADSDWNLLPEGVDSLAISALKEWPGVEVSAPEVAWAPPLSPHLLRARIEEKERLLPSYRVNADSVWLILIAHHGSIASIFENPTAATTHTFTTEFDRVFFFEWATGKVLELMCSRATG